MNIEDIKGFYRSPYNSETVVYMTNGECIAVQYPDTTLGIFSILRKPFFYDLYYHSPLDMTYGALRQLEKDATSFGLIIDKAPVMPEPTWLNLKGKIILYGNLNKQELDKLHYKILRQYFNYSAALNIIHKWYLIDSMRAIELTNIPMSEELSDETLNKEKKSSRQKNNIDKPSANPSDNFFGYLGQTAQNAVFKTIDAFFNAFKNTAKGGSELIIIAAITYFIWQNYKNKSNTKRLAYS